MAIGVTLLQQNQLVAYATKAFTPAQRLFPQIGKEALAVKFGCKKFYQFIYGQDIEIENEERLVHIIASLPDEASQRYAKSTAADAELGKLTEFINNGWPDDSKKIPSALEKYANFREELA